ncbi:hypothetical protein AB0K18_40555 [Nonomuraea sp. NPDC049421]|uniref:hypothetical protein n=1 Tax=Nonomuraea sp. NPDC049421 TaxID=3155275 RepID=UPI0034347772
MGEFVGIDPRGAHELIRRMEAGKAYVSATRPGLETAIAEAEQDWAGRQGTTALHRAWVLFHDSQQDLRWRIDTIEQLVPVRERGMLTATFPFTAEHEARQAAESAARAILAAEREGERTGERDGERAGGDVAAAVAAVEGEVRDPAYATALLSALGTEAFTRLLEGHGGPLAQAYASAERTGRLGDAWHELVATAPAGALTALVTGAGQSGTVLNRVATTLLNRPQDTGWSPGDLLRPYAANPLAFQQLLAEHPRESRALLGAATADPAAAQALATALHEALKPGVGADGLRERAWATVIGTPGGRTAAEGG